MPNKLIVTSVNGGFDTQLEVDGTLIDRIDSFDCDSAPVITESESTCPDTGQKKYEIRNNKGDRSAGVTADCFILDSNPVTATDLFTFLDGICPTAGVGGATEETLQEVLDTLQDTRIKDFEYTGYCVYDKAGDEIVPPVKQYKILICDYEGTLVSESYILNQHNTDGTVSVYTLGAGEEVKPCVSSGNVDPINISDKLKVDGLTGTLTACTSFDFAWAVTGSGQLSVTNTVTGRTTIYPYADGLAPFNAVDEDRELLETYTFDATAAVGLYLNTQGCRIVTP